MIKVRRRRKRARRCSSWPPCFARKVLDIAAESIIVEITGGEEKVDRLLELLRPFGLMEVVRTGIVAMRRGVSKVPAATSKSAGPVVVDDDTVSYSV